MVIHSPDCGVAILSDPSVTAGEDFWSIFHDFDRLKNSSNDMINQSFVNIDVLYLIKNIFYHEYFIDNC